ncbi:hypothetical protein HDV06_001103 [Boothiomyces sp. JEL0866]|nr:hypothetical protein HDV06_001103 [Boothiomyces sp. JEL0866]
MRVISCCELKILPMSNLKFSSTYLYVDIHDSNQAVYIEKAVVDALDKASTLTIVLGFTATSFQQTQVVLHEVYALANRICWDLQYPLFPIDVVIDEIAGELPPPELEYVATIQRYNSAFKKLDSAIDGLKYYKEYQLTHSLAEDLKYYDNVALGGTFDRLHSGHKLLLSMAILICKKRLICGVTDFKPEALMKKRYYEYIQPLNERLDLVRAFLMKFKPGVSLEVVAIQDDYGPTRTDSNIQAIVGSMETKRGCEMVNVKRKEVGYNELDIYLVDCVGGDNKLSSSAIRTFLYNKEHLVK